MVDTERSTAKLRGLLSSAIAQGDAELETELRRELRIATLEVQLARIFGDGPPLSQVEVFRVQQMIAGYGRRAPEAVDAAV